MRRFDVGDRVFGNLFLLVRGVENRRAVARAPVVALTIARGGVVDLKEELQQRPIVYRRGIESDLDCLGMTFMVAIGRILYLAARVADTCRDHTRLLADEVLHAPEATSGEDCALCRHVMCSRLVL